MRAIAGRPRPTSSEPKATRPARVGQPTPSTTTRPPPTSSTSPSPACPHRLLTASNSVDGPKGKLTGLGRLQCRPSRDDERTSIARTSALEKLQRVQPSWRGYGAVAHVRGGSSLSGSLERLPSSSAAVRSGSGSDRSHGRGQKFKSRSPTLCPLGSRPSWRPRARVSLAQISRRSWAIRCPRTSRTERPRFPGARLARWSGPSKRSCDSPPTGIGPHRRDDRRSGRPLRPPRSRSGLAPVRDPGATRERRRRETIQPAPRTTPLSASWR